MNNNILVDEEREYLTDSIYLQEAQMEIEQEFYRPEIEGQVEIDWNEIKLTNNKTN